MFCYLRHYVAGHGTSLTVHTGSVYFSKVIDTPTEFLEVQELLQFAQIWSHNQGVSEKQLLKNQYESRYLTCPLGRKNVFFMLLGWLRLLSVHEGGSFF